MRNFLRRWIIPPKIIDILSYSKKQIMWSGNFSSWAEVSELCSGYDSPEILEKVTQSTLQVLSGKAAYERDSVAFKIPEYNWPLASMLLWIANKQKNKLNILDFGGSLGSIYFQHKKLLSSIVDLTWNIVEQKHFVENGIRFIKDPKLNFFNSIEESQKIINSHVILLSGVLPYLEKPHEFIDNIIQEKFPYILIEKTPFFEIDKGKDRLTLQTVKKPIYDASYPAWFFSKQKFLLHFDASYELLFTFSHDGQSMAGTTYQGMLFKLR